MHTINQVIATQEWPELQQAVELFFVEVSEYLKTQEPYDTIKYDSHQFLCKQHEPYHFIVADRGLIRIQIIQGTSFPSQEWQYHLRWRAALFNNGRELHSSKG